MNILKRDDLRISTSPAGAVEANQTSTKWRLVHRMHGWLLDGPDYVASGAGTTGTDFEQVRDQGVEVVTGDTAALAEKPVPLSANGEIDSKHRQIRAAQLEVRLAYDEQAATPDPSQIEDLLLPG